MQFSITTALVGLLVGFFVGLTGVGGGVILAPILISMGIAPSVAVGTDLVYGSITKLVGTVRNVRDKRVDWPWALTLAAGSIPAGIAGSYLIAYFRNHDSNAESIVLHCLGGVLVIAASANVVSELFVKGKTVVYWADWTPIDSKSRLKVMFVGAIIGLMVGLTSVGSGSLFAMLLMFTSRLPMQKLVGTDIAHAMLLVTASSLAHIDIGTVNYALAGNLLIGSIPGVLIGGRLMGIVPARNMKLMICVLVLLAGVKMLA